MIVYFSGTGNSRYCAQYLADHLDDELLDIHQYIKNGIGADLISGKPWIFVAPTYAWRLPRVFENFIRTGSFSGSEEAYFVLTCGSEIGNAAAHLKPLCQEKRFRYMGVLQVTMPENYLAMFKVPSAEECGEIIRRAEAPLGAGVQAIRAGKPFAEGKVSLLDRMKTAINPAFYKLCVHAKKFRADERCISCGRCAQVCPLNNIRLEYGRPVWEDTCTHCMACICSCPAQAIEYGKTSVGQRRYQCPPYGEK